MKRWANRAIPVLGGMTPKQSLKENKNIPLLLDLIKEEENSADRKGEFEDNSSFSKGLGIDIVRYQEKNQ